MSWESFRQGIASALKSCGKDTAQVRQIHASIVAHDAHLLQRDTFLANHLIDAYGKCSSSSTALDCAVGVFRAIHHPNLFSWNAIVGAHAQIGHLDQGYSLVLKMPQWHPNPCAMMIRALGLRLRVAEARELFDLVPERDRFIWNVMVSAYAQRGDMNEAMKLFLRMDGRDVITWTTVIRGFALLGVFHEAEALFARIPAATAVSWNTMIVMNAERGDAVQSKRLFDRMPEPTIVSRTAMLGVYAQAGRIDEAEVLFSAMPEESRDTVSWTTMLQALALHGELDRAKEVFDRMPCRDAVAWTTMLAAFSQSAGNSDVKSAGALFHRMPQRDVVAGNAMLAAYAHGGLVDQALELFHSSLHAADRNLVTWTTLVAGFAHSGHGELALELFQEMILDGSAMPDEIIFLSVLGACGHVGLVKIARSFFLAMVADHGISPILEHYCCMIDIMARTGKLGDAEELANSMPFLPNDLVWASLIAACRNQQDLELGTRIATQAIEQSPGNYTAYVLLANLHSKAGRFEESAKIRKLMAEKGLTKQPGASTIRIDGRVYRFVAGDLSQHPDREEVLAAVDRICRLLGKHGGHSPEIAEVMHDVAEGDKVRILSHHSERLAMALGVARTSPGAPLTIVKNLRVCSDCHSTIKLASKALGRRISVRDASRFHHFSDGKCSCQDYW
ncbi:pentatricopeptide repeat-containing protein At4g02750 [Selaginella moellendorffii]|nr:pentatricopeptide repeat-containing protein At4g02750 [Selaginella moellendorffii]XP_024538806.1 pentatricopeptide repeat-containing protein At4g02750 [Selaginella moellendorffii]|eukprot:XP_002978226.2 pentatricopeptide repeat-containing protein At4g02750 [Selaginella moellendorffii]